MTDHLVPERRGIDDRVTNRRGFLAGGLGSAAGLLALAPAALAAQAAADSAAARAQVPGSGETGRLFDPRAVGRSRRPTHAKDNDAEIKAVEQHLACTCGCTLDIYTCRTTDFTCTYSPELHREVVALHEEGKTAQQIIDAFVAKYGEKALMAPKPEGFNLAGYLVPGILILFAATLLVWIIVRRRNRLAPLAVASTRSEPSPVAGATADELERLKRELSEVED